MIQSSSCVRLFVTPWIAACRPPCSFLSQSLKISPRYELSKFTSTESVMPSKQLILCRPLPLLPSVFPSIRIFSNELALCIRGPKYWINIIISPSKEHSGLTSFRMDWLDLCAVQETLKRLLQHHSSKASILRCSAFFMVQLLHHQEAL